MLDHLLRIMAQGGVNDYGDLACKLNVSAGLLDQMLEDLSRMGYLRALGEDCGETCEGCPLAAQCKVRGQGRVWVLTQKGARRAQENQYPQGKQSGAITWPRMV